MNCDAPATIKRAYAEQLPPLLVAKFGKKKHYAREEILATIRYTGLPLDYSCWAMSLFEAPDAFNAFHNSIGEACNYIAMQAEMLQFIPESCSDAWFHFHWDWIPWDIFDWFDWTR